jgi:cell division protease FtsH
MQEFFEEFKNNEGRQKMMAEFSKKAITGWIVLQTALNTPMPAFADGEIATKMAAPGGTVSYTTFLQGVKEHLIDRVRIDPTGRTAEFLNVDGVKGQVNLFNDPNLLKILQENQIDLSVIPQDPGNPIFGVL